MKVVPRTPGPTSETFNGSGYFLHSLKSQLPSHINRFRTGPNHGKPTLGSAVDPLEPSFPLTSVLIPASKGSALSRARPSIRLLT
jgi:hypothetical protein